MRFYSFSNMYLSSLQVGLQSAHVVADMFVKYAYHDKEAETLRDWATDHKTMILLNGGYSASIRELVQFFGTSQNPYPWTEFHEGQDALDGALTSVGIILPEKIYQTSAWLRSLRFSDKKLTLQQIEDTGSLPIPKELYEGDDITNWDFNRWEYQLIQKLNDFRMAS